MKEYGSDFHYCTDFINDGYTIIDDHSSNYYANGRHAIVSLILDNDWKRIWMPSYFCYDVIDEIKTTGIEILYYSDAPAYNDIIIIDSIPFKKNDVLFRMNYFGLRGWRDNSNTPVEVIEDHSHDLIGEWAKSSNADWCIASLRKTLPLPEGGVLWSPKNHLLPVSPKISAKVERIVSERRKAMILKRDYLLNLPVEKPLIRELFIRTENELVNADLSSITESTRNFLIHFEIDRWYSQKKTNWNILADIKSDKVEILHPDNIDDCNPLSLILKFNSKSDREFIRKRLISLNIYPSILWPMPNNTSNGLKSISDTILSIPCDGRYTPTEVNYVKTTLKNILAEL